MSHATASGDDPYPPRLLAHAPEELTTGRLRRLGEGIGKVVYASEHWVVKRERSTSEILALVVIWKLIRRVEHLLPGRMGARLLERPSRQIRLLRVIMQGLVMVVPRGVWFMTHIGEVFRIYVARDERGESLAVERLHGTMLVPERVRFPSTRIRVSGWPGWLSVCEAAERVEDTLYHRLTTLAAEGRFFEFEHWLDRFLDTRQAGWRRGVFSVDAHLKNFGVIGDRVVLLDPGGLTDHWEEISSRLSFEKNVAEPHVQLGLGRLLDGHPEIAQRFNARWKEIVSHEGVLRHWPAAS